MSVTIYHNPRCSKSRQALQLLTDNGIEPQIIEYLKTPPSATEIKKILKLLKISARGLIREKESLYAELNLDNTMASEEDLVKAMADNPILMERPVVIANGKAVIGRPPDAVLKII